MAVLEALWLPKAVAIVHYEGHQKGDSPKAQGIKTADQAARKAALKPVGPQKVLVTMSGPGLLAIPTYTKVKEKPAEENQATKESSGWFRL